MTYDFREIPLEKIVRLGQRTLLYRDLFVVSWLLGRFCNYRCSYCWPYGRSDKKDHRPTSLILSTVDEIKRQARARGFNSFHFSFSGGEPTLHPGYLEIISHLAQDQDQCNYQSIHMTSNISRSMEWLELYAKAGLSLNRVSVTASFHKEHAKREIFKDKLVFLQSLDIQVTINMVMVPQRFSELWGDATYFHEHGLNVTLKPQSNSTATKVVDGYTDEQLAILQTGLPQRDYTANRLIKSNLVSNRPKAKLGAEYHTAPHAPPSEIRQVLQVELDDTEGKKWYMDQAERFNSFDFNQFKGWTCSSGYRSIIIREPDGVIKRGYSCNDRPLGHIEKGFNLFPIPQPCSTRSCVSSADSKIPKRKAGCALPLFPGDISGDLT